MDNQEKQKKGMMSMSTFKYSIPKNDPPKSSDTTLTTKKSISHSWGGLRRSKTTREKVHGDGGQRVVEGGRGGGEVVVEVAESRKSVSHVESNLSSVVSFLQVRVLVADMPGFMQVHAFRCARRTYDSLEKFSSKHMAYNLKKEFDKVYGPAWHCIVGSSFGSFVTHSTGGFLYFSMEKLYILVFKTKVQKTLD